MAIAITGGGYRTPASQIPSDYGIVENGMSPNQIKSNHVYLKSIFVKIQTLAKGKVKINNEKIPQLGPYTIFSS